MSGSVRRFSFRSAVGSAVASLAVLAAIAAWPHAARASTPTCQLRGPGGLVTHVVYIQFDNVHFRRDNPNVPSDLEQMPHLLKFMEGNGTLLTRHYTPLVSHTADDLLTSITGLYGDRHGMPIANEYQAYNPDGTSFTAGSFAYWTDPVVSYSSADSSSTDPLPTMVGPGGVNAPAPWVPYTRAGCTFGSVAMANTELENTVPDVAHVFGSGSPQAAEANSAPDTAATDFEGLSVHCAKGATLCSQQNGGVADLLPDEPGGYNGYQALFGSKYVAPAITGGQPTVTNFNGQPIMGPSDNPGHPEIPGFPGYNGLQPVNSLAYTLAMQKAGIPVTFTYISSAHEAVSGTQYGPGEQAYVDQLHQFDHDFAIFFSKLAAIGITPSNTLFLFGSDENDHFVGSNPSPANCNGITVFCSYSRVGEINLNVQGMLAQQGNMTPFRVAADSAPEFYLTGQPGSSGPTVRNFERTVASLQAPNPYTGGVSQLSQYLADPAELQILHMITADPRRTPTFALFANPDYWVQGNGRSCNGSCASFSTSDAWNHGDVQPQITDTWVGMAGPGVANQGENDSLWSDHADIQPTLMALLGLHDDYTPEGRVLEEIIPPGMRAPAASGADYTKLADLYKQIDAPVGELGMETLQASTNAIRSDAPGDRTYKSVEYQLSQISNHRDEIAGQMIHMLDAAAFANKPIDHQRAEQLEDQARTLLEEASQLASQG